MNASSPQIEQRLTEEERKWHYRRNSAPDPASLFECTKRMQELSEARHVLLDGRKPASAPPPRPPVPPVPSTRRPAPPPPPAPPRVDSRTNVPIARTDD